MSQRNEPRPAADPPPPAHRERDRRAPSGDEKRDIRDDANRMTPNRGHGTPGGSLGSLNETDDGLRDSDAAEKGDTLP